jgi:hypothetical protein
VCPSCQMVYSRSTSLKRHALSAHQLGWVGGQLIRLTPVELHGQQQLLRLQQMSAVNRRRHRARVPELSLIESRPEQRVAAVRQPSDWDEFFPIVDEVAPFELDGDWSMQSNPEVTWALRIQSRIWEEQRCRIYLGKPHACSTRAYYLADRFDNPRCVEFVPKPEGRQPDQIRWRTS